MTKEEAKELDRILNKLRNSSPILGHDLFETDSINILRSDGLLNIEYTDAGMTGKLTDKGLVFINSGGFTAQVEKEEFVRYHTKETIQQAKRANAIACSANWIAIIALLVALLALGVALAEYLKDEKENKQPFQKQSSVSVQKDSGFKAGESKIKTAKHSKRGLRICAKYK